MTEVIGEVAKRVRIRELNDPLRTTFPGGGVMCSAGLAVMPEAARGAALQAVRTFNRFDGDADPYGEQDSGEVISGHRRLLFKIDHYNRDMAGGSPDPSGAAATTRVLTIMLAEEY